MPEPRITPQRQRSSLAKSKPESLDGIDAGDEGELHEAVEFLDFLGFDVAVGGEIDDLAADPRTELRGVEALDHAHAALALDDARPKFFHAATERGHRTETCYDDAPFHVSSMVAEG